MIPQEIFVEFGGKKKKVTPSELRTLAQKKYVTANSSVWIDGNQARLGDVNDLLDVGITGGSRDNSSTNDSGVVFTEASKNLDKTVNLDKASDSPDAENQVVLNLPIEVPVPGAGSTAAVPEVSGTNRRTRIILVLTAGLFLALILGVVFTRSAEKSSDVDEKDSTSVENVRVDANSVSDFGADNVEVSTFKVDDQGTENTRDEVPTSGEEFEFDSNDYSQSKNESVDKASEKDAPTDFYTEPREVWSRSSHKNDEKPFRYKEETRSSEGKYESDDVFENRSSVVSYLNEPFELTGDRLPVGFRGVDVRKLQEKIAESLSELNLKQLSYESDKEYGTRLKRTYRAFLDEELLGEITFLSRIAIVFPAEENIQDGQPCPCAESSYDSVQKRLVVTLVDSIGFKRFRYDEDERCDVSVVYEKSGVHQEFNLENARWVISDVPKDQGQKLNDSCAVLCVCSLQTGVNTDDLNRSYDDLYTSKFWTLYKLYAVSKRTLYVKKTEYWIYNEKTGEVVAKFDEQETLHSQSKSWKEATDDLAASSSSSAVRTNRKDDNMSEQQEEPAQNFRMITVPDDAKTLAKAYEQARKNDVILLRKSSKPYSLGTDATWLKIAKKIVIKGETGDPSDVSICFEKGQSLSIILDGVSFEGITFLRQGSIHDVCVSTQNDNIQFQRCDFKCYSVGEDAIGLSIKGYGATCILNDCNFINFKICALDIDDNGKAIVTDCNFEKNEKSIHLRRKGSCDVRTSLFLSNKTAIRVESECEATVNGCNFKGNDKAWDREAGSIVHSSDNEGDK